MILDLKSLFDGGKDKLLFECRLDFSKTPPVRRLPLDGPVLVKGRAIQTAGGVVFVEYGASYTATYSCDRCLEPVTVRRTARVSQVAVRKLDSAQEVDGEEYFVLPDARLDLVEAVYADILLDMPTKVLCRKNCRGLCPDCGANLNDGPCHCARETVDPRLRPLMDLLDGSDGSLN